MGNWDKVQNPSVGYLFLYISPMYLPAPATAMSKPGVSSGKYQVPRLLSREPLLLVFIFMWARISLWEKHFSSSVSKTFHLDESGNNH